MPQRTYTVCALVQASINAAIGCRQERVPSDFLTLSSALRVFEMDNGRLPTEEEGLAILVSRERAIADLPDWRRCPGNPGRVCGIGHRLAIVGMDA